MYRVVLVIEAEIKTEEEADGVKQFWQPELTGYMQHMPIGAMVVEEMKTTVSE